MTSFLLFLLVGSAHADEHRYVALAGTEGPLFTAQAFGTALIGRRLSERFEFDLVYSFGSNQGRQNGPVFKIETEGYIISAPVSYWPWGCSSNQFLKVLFVRTGPAFQDMRNERQVSGPGKLNWHSQIYGLELGVGGRVTDGRWTIEFIPITYFKRVHENILSGVPLGDGISQSFIELRMLTVRAGISF